MACQKYILKIHSARLRNSNWDLILPLTEARKNDEVISIADSQMLRWIDELNGIVDADAQARMLKCRIRQVRKERNSAQNRKLIREYYDELDSLQFKSDYMCLIIDKKKDYLRACRGFSINGIRYERLLGTSGGIKNSTIVFVSKRLAAELKRRVENGRDASKPMVPAKLEAYKALTCSASIPVSYPKGLLVVKDNVTEFLGDVIYMSDGDGDEPEARPAQGEKIRLKASDGCGMMLPSLAERWSAELGLSYTASGVNTRISFEKGMVFTFDFRAFASEVAKQHIVKDAWGNEVDINDVELVLTTSMLKLWDSYKDCNDYLEKCHENHYTFAVTKVCSESLENEHTLNYQFIQPFPLDDDDIEGLIRPTLDGIRDILDADRMKTVLFTKGIALNDERVAGLDNDYIKALMIEPEMINDPYVQSSIYRAIRGRINDAKIGVLDVHGNYSIACGDLYALCQSMFDMDVTGLLKAGEIYNKYWYEAGSDSLVCFRAPMSTFSNIRAVTVNRSPSVSYWYQYITSGTIFNCWDTACAALNGMDYDGDLVMLTDNEILIRNHKVLPALMCIQKDAPKKIVTDNDLIESNIASFGNEIGQTTNRVTSMYEVRTAFATDSVEYKELSYRINAGQKAQQDVIDRAKGIICKPMPKTWYDRHAVEAIQDSDRRELYRRIVADRKPYFMIYIYPALMKEYRTFVKNADKNCMRRYGITINELLSAPASDLTKEQAEFVMQYLRYIPVGMNNCVMNKICRRFEDEFDGYVARHDASTEFDYRIMKSDADYSASQYKSIYALYMEYNRRLRNYTVFAEIEKVDKDSMLVALSIMDDDFRRECANICSDRSVLCNILLDMCYSKNLTKRFVWSMCGDEIIHNLLKRNNYTICYPVQDNDGEITFGGLKFTKVSMRMGVAE